MKSISIKIPLLCLLLAAVVSSGCNKKVPNPDGREDVQGKITLNGKALEGNASIRFVPLEGSDKRAGGGGQISESKFLLTGEDGVKPGKYKVQISAYLQYDRKTEAPATKETGDFDYYKVMVIPPEFNEKTTVEFEVTAGKKNVFDYDIVTDYVPNTKPPKGQAAAIAE